MAIQDCQTLSQELPAVSGFFMTKDNLINLIGLEKYIYETIEYDPYSYQLFTGEFELSDLILDEMGFPEDNTIELGLDHKDSFCRDYLNNIIWEPRVSKNKTYRLLVREMNELQLDNKRP